MRLKLFLLMLLTVTLPALAQKTALSGKVVDSSTGLPVAGAIVMLDNQGLSVTTGPNGEFLINNANLGNDNLVVIAYGYNDLSRPLAIADGMAALGEFRMSKDSSGMNYDESQEEMRYDQQAIEDEEGNSQTIGVLGGANDNIFQKAAAYNFSIMRFRTRGYDNYFSKTYINGVPMNDLARGRFNFSSLGGMTSSGFRNRTNTIGMDAALYGFGGIGGTTNYNTFADSYAPGFRGSVSYTNANYMFRGMAMYSTGISKTGWGVTVAGIGRYADEGVIPGTFYKSGGLFMSIQKVFNPRHSLSLTVFGAPTQRATNSATFLEVYDLTGDNLYNPNWGWQNGKKRNSRIVQSFDPTAMLNWLWKPQEGTSLNTGVALRNVNYSSSRLNWYNAADPNPVYYRYLPSYYKDNPEAYDLYTDLWQHDASMRQIDWDELYRVNDLNNQANAANPNGTQKGSTYILEDRHSNQLNAIFSTVLNHRVSRAATLQAGASVNYTRASYYKTIRDLLGGEFWLDIDGFSERDYPDNDQLLQNNLNNPNRKVGKGDKFGYDYNIYAINANLWAQNMITLPHWDINYGFEVNYTQFYRDGHMRNGRAPENSYGKGTTHRFDDASVKLGLVYKINGRNAIAFHADYGTKAPLFEYAYISPSIKDTAVDGLKSMRVASFDLSYTWNYRRFRGQLSAFYTDMFNMTERTSFYDDQYSTFMNYVMKDVRQNYKGVELGMSFKIAPSVTATAAGTVARYLYKNNPTGVRSYENGMADDIETLVYLKNHHVGGTPQMAGSLGLDWAAPKMWFFSVNASWMGNSYVNLSPVRHEAITDLWTKYPTEAGLEAAQKELMKDERLRNAFTLNASVGKLIYLTRRTSLNINLNVDNILNDKDIMTYGYQQGRFDYTNLSGVKYPNRYYFAQGIKVFLNVGIKF